ncbi:MAG: response regulator [Deltaproteobacteria bacterium]|nr:response regulator [Deltaproteobacteria bacterium]
MLSLTNSQISQKILVVDDNPDLTHILELHLNSLGYDTLPAKSGRQALELAASEQPDLITLDITLPDMDGLEVARSIRQNSKTRDIPIIAVTARFLPEDRAMCIQGGCNDYISKPFTFRHLAARIENLLK